MTDPAVRHHVGKTSVLRRCAISVALAVSGTALSASPYAQNWAAFVTRCLEPFERFAPVDLDGLVEIGHIVDGFHLTKGAMLLLNTDDTGTRSCTVMGPGLAKGFETWRAQAETDNRYVQIAPGIWHSSEWIEPVIEVRRGADFVTVVETDLES